MLSCAAQPASRVSLVCSVPALQRDARLAIDILQQFQAEGEDEDWQRIADADDRSLIHALAQHLSAIVTAPSVRECAVYSAVLHLLFVFASLSPDTVCPALLQHGILSLPIIVTAEAGTEAETLTAMVLLRLQLLALTLSSCHSGESLPSPHPLLLQQTLTLLKDDSADVQLAASACAFLLLSVSALPLALPVLLSHPNLSSFLSSVLSLLTPGNESPFLPLALTVVDNVSGWMGVRESRGEDRRISDEAVLQLWDAVCELLEAEGERAEEQQAARADVIRSSVHCLSSLLSLPSMRSPVTLEQYSRYKRQFPQIMQEQQQDGLQIEEAATTQPGSASDLPAATAAAAALESADEANDGQPLSALVPFTAADYEAILDSSSPSHALSPAALAGKLSSLQSLLSFDGRGRDEWQQYLESCQYRLILVLAIFHTQQQQQQQAELSDALLSCLLSLSSLSSESSAIAAAALSHPSFLAVIIAQLQQLHGAAASASAFLYLPLLTRLRLVLLALMSPSSPMREEQGSDRDASSSSSPSAFSPAALFDAVLPFLSHSDGVVVIVSVYLLLLSHPPHTPVPAALTSISSSYAMQSEMLHLLNRGALPVLSSSTLSDDEREDVSVLLVAVLVFLHDLLCEERGRDWVYSTDLRVLMDVAMQRIEDAGEVREDEADEATDAVLLCQALLLVMVEAWQGWTADGGHKRRQLTELMTQLTAEASSSTAGPRTAAVLAARRQQAEEVLQAMARLPIA